MYQKLLCNGDIMVLLYSVRNIMKNYFNYIVFSKPIGIQLKMLSFYRRFEGHSNGAEIIKIREQFASWSKSPERWFCSLENNNKYLYMVICIVNVQKCL